MQDRTANTALEDQFFVDSGVTYDSTAATTITGLTHLNGKTVSILADGIVLAQQVVASGQITLATAASTVQVGLPYNADFESLNVEIKTKTVPTIQSMRVKIPTVVIKVINSQGGKVGVSSSDLRALNYDAIVGYSSTALYTGDVPATLGGGYGNDGKIFIRQSDPLPITVTTLVPKVVVGGTTQVL